MTKNELIRNVARSRAITVRDSRAIVNAMVSSIERALSEGEDVTLRSFGSFRLERRAPRRLRVPATGEWINVPARLAPVFRGAEKLNEQVAEEAESGH